MFIWLFGISLFPCILVSSTSILEPIQEIQLSNSDIINENIENNMFNRNASDLSNRIEIKVEYTSEAVAEASSHQESYSRSVRFVETFKSMDASLSVEGSGAVYSGALSAALSLASKDVTNSEDERKSVSGRTIKYTAGTFQVWRTVTTTISMNWQTLVDVSKTHVTSPSTNPTYEQLLTLAKNYLKDYYGTDGSAARINFNYDTTPKAIELANGGQIANKGQNCYRPCHEVQGKCDWCGADGWCCRKGWTGNGCDGTFGIENHHTCVLHPFPNQGKIANGGQNCWEGCHEVQGKCNWCGSSGWCCRKDWVGNGCNGNFGIANHHTCVLQE